MRKYLASLILGTIILAGCGDKGNPLKDASNAVGNAADQAKQKAQKLENFAADRATQK